MAKILVIDSKLAFEYDLERIDIPFFVINLHAFPFKVEEQLELLKITGFDVLYVIGREAYDTIKEISKIREDLGFTVVLTEGIKFRSKWKWGVIYNFSPKGAK